MSSDCGRGKQPSISSSTSGAPWPRLAQSSGSSRKPNSAARSVHQTTPVEARVASRPAWGRWPSWAARNWRWTLLLASERGRMSASQLDGCCGKRQAASSRQVTVDARFANGEPARGLRDTRIPVDAELATVHGGQRRGGKKGLKKRIEGLRVDRMQREKRRMAEEGFASRRAK